MNSIAGETEFLRGLWQAPFLHARAGRFVLGSAIYRLFRLTTGAARARV
jgi:hypothetical protein